MLLPSTSFPVQNGPPHSPSLISSSAVGFFLLSGAPFYFYLLFLPRRFCSRLHDTDGTAPQGEDFSYDKRGIFQEVFLCNTSVKFFRNRSPISQKNCALLSLQHALPRGTAGAQGRDEPRRHLGVCKGQGEEGCRK